MDEIKLYEYEEIKPEIEDLIMHYNHNHDPRNGQFTTSSGKILYSPMGKKVKPYKDKKTKKKRKEEVKTKEQAIEDKDLSYIRDHVDDFSTKELNDILNRINVESRLDEAVGKNKNKKEIKKIMSSPEFKLAAALALTSLGYASYNAYKGVNANPPRLTDKSNPYYKQFFKDMTSGAGKYVEKRTKKKLGL